MPGSGAGETPVSAVRIAIAISAVTMLLALWSGAASAVPLPDGRAFELVSSPLKNGGEIMPDSQRARASADGSAMSFAALSGFADVASMGASTDYMSVRTGAFGTSGWATHALAPPQSAMPFVADTAFMEPAYWGEFSDDLSRGVFRSFSPVTAAPLVANQQNWYLRDDLRAPGTGSYQLLTDCPACSAPIPGVSDPLLLQEQSWLAGASQDFGHVIFESRLPLTADATADPNVPRWNLYEWDHGTVRLAGVLPDSACGSPPCAAPASGAGQGAKDALYTANTISADGSLIYFTVPAASCTAGLPNCGDLYLRSDHASTLQLNASEKTNGSGPGGTDPAGPEPAQFSDASRDGLRAFFVSTEALTDDAPADTDRKLYMYSLTPDGQGHHLTFVSVDHQPADDAFTSDDVLGVLGVSDDGHSVYFDDGGGQLDANASTAPTGVSDKLFRWHDGSVDYVGGMTRSAAIPNIVNGFTNYIGTAKQARVSPDGRFLLFVADRGNGLTGYNHGSCPGNGTPGGTCRELYIYRADATPHLLCASCNPTGARATADATATVHTGVGGAAVTSHLNHPLSDDGRRVFFSSGEALVPQDTNGKVDAYEYDVASGSLHLLSSGTDPSDSYFLDASRSGDDAFILTRQKLTGWDVDGGYDIYDARVGGGVPDPVAHVPCTVDTCRGPVPAPPDAAAAQSESAVGSNVPPGRRAAKHCRRGFVRKRVHGKVRCVKKPKARRHARHRSAR
jgi:WD40-like Beta Propeller Repeat